MAKRVTLIKNVPSAAQRMRIIRDVVAANSKSVLQINVKMHQEITKNFSTANKPEWFIQTTGVTKRKLKVGYTASKARGLRKNKSVYWLLNNGTNVRRVKLSPNWVSKTTPGRVGSGAGQGVVLDVGKQYNFAGIKAGNWDEAINKILKPQVDNNLIKGYSEGLKKAHGR